jgi:hypothetical protein
MTAKARPSRAATPCRAKLLSADRLRRDRAAEDREPGGPPSSCCLLWLPMRRAEEQHLGDRKRFGVSYGEKRAGCPEPGEPTRGASVQPELRRPSTAHHFDVPPQHAAGVSRAERFHGGFLGGKSTGHMWGWIAARDTVGELSIGQDTAEEALTKAVDCRADAWNVGGIEAHCKDGRSDRVRHTPDSAAKDAESRRMIAAEAQGREEMTAAEARRRED